MSAPDRLLSLTEVAQLFSSVLDDVNNDFARFSFPIVTGEHLSAVLICNGEVSSEGKDSRTASFTVNYTREALTICLFVSQSSSYSEPLPLSRVNRYALLGVLHRAIAHAYQALTF